MEELKTNAKVDSLVFLYTSPLRDANYTNWVDSNRFRNLTLVSRGTVENINLLSSGYLNGMVGEIHYDMGKRSAEVLVEIAMKLAVGQLSLPLKDKLFPTKFLSHSVIPLDLDETEPFNLDQNLLGNLVYIGYTAFGIVAMTALVCAIWTFRKRNEIVVRTAQPFFLMIVISGIIIFASTIIPLSFDDGGEPDAVGDTFAVGVCMSQPWLAFTGFSVIFSALFSKTWRVNRLFNSQQGHARVQVSKMQVLTPFAITFSFNVIVLACWTAFDPLTYTRLAGDGTDFWNREIETYGVCRSDKALAFLLPLAVINMVVLGIACWQAFEGRNIESAFSESRYIGYSVASLFQAFLTGLPISVIVKDDPLASYVVLTLMIFVLSEGILFLIFLPKMIMAYNFSLMSLKDQRQEISAQIRKSTGDGGSKFFHAGLSADHELISKIPEHQELALEVVDGVLSDPGDSTGAPDQGKTDAKGLSSAPPLGSNGWDTTNSDTSTSSSGFGKYLDGAVGTDPPPPMEDPVTSSETQASTPPAVDGPACPSESERAPLPTPVSEQETIRA
jgi:gamma-aminobutyric acid type B receptor